MKAEWTNKDSLSIESTGKKAVLVIDMPAECVKCNQFVFECCHAIKREIERENIVQCTRPEWCPLKPMPEKKEEGTYTDDSEWIHIPYNEGWNACLDEICKERNERKSLLKTEKESVSNRGDI